ncbi:hypothetical protein Pcinc_010982 [Petrolisthes cinctipes]|uniref:Uncharacterized protein n=1 Tax=Petrolisthes cinctipes TaxID=88211 RepID=A0AAE1KT36_PETCI|nr:hypothetical protein Pcinc_010982 [Petrolisthes cinctipes]
MAAADAALLLELMDDSDEVNALMMMMQENQSMSQVHAAVFHTLSRTEHRNSKEAEPEESTPTFDIMSNDADEGKREIVMAKLKDSMKE